MPDKPAPGREVQRAMRQALQAVLREIPADLPPELREVVAGEELIRVARELQIETVRAARGEPMQWLKGARTTTALGHDKALARHPWEAIASALGMARQSAHQRWAHEL